MEVSAADDDEVKGDWFFWRMLFEVRGELGESRGEGRGVCFLKCDKCFGGELIGEAELELRGDDRRTYSMTHIFISAVTKK